MLEIPLGTALSRQPRSAAAADLIIAARTESSGRTENPQSAIGNP
jgi:hypothetical protein